jgi:replicative DNA helicase/5S rRNA maturation endonuclease (ribonuclease M5)
MPFKGQVYEGTIKEYLIGLRKHSEECIAQARLGASDGLLTEYLLSQGYELKHIRASGLIKQDRDLFGKGLVLYPHFVNGKISHYSCKDPRGKLDPYQIEARFRDSGWRFYNQDCVLDDTVEDKAVIIVEGENDLLSVVYKGGISKCIGQSGQLTDEKIKFLQGLAQQGWSLILAQDSDMQGKKYRNSIIDKVIGNIYNIPISEDAIIEGKDIDDLLGGAEDAKEFMVSLLRKQESNPKLYVIPKEEKVDSSKKKEEIIPHSLEHERYILRNFIRGNFGDEILDRIKNPKVFYSSLHQKMFSAVKDLYDLQKDINELSCYTMFYDRRIIRDDSEYDEVVREDFMADIDSALDILIKKWRRRELIEFGNETIKQGKDESTIIEQIEDKVSDRFFALTKFRDSRALEISGANIVDTNLAGDKPFRLIGTPYKDMNEILTLGFDHGNIIVIAGRPGMGKSIFKLNLKKYWLENQVGVLDFSPENRVPLEQARLDALISGISSSKILTRQKGDAIDLQCQEVHMMMVEQKWPFWLFEELENLSFAFIVRKLRQAKRERPDVEKWIVVADLANKVKEFRESNNRDWVKSISIALREVKILAQTIGFCFVPIVQIGRGAEREKKIEKKKPHLKDLKESGSWEEDSDGVFLLYRERYYDISIDSDIIEINLAKQRAGSAAIFEKLYIGSLAKIDDLIMGSNEELPPLEG